MKRVFLLSAFCCLLSGSAFAWGGAPDWLRALAKAPVPSYPDDIPGVALLDETMVTVSPGGAILTHHRRAYKILGTEGRNLGYVSVYFDGGTRVTGLHAWGIDAKGQEYEVKDGDAVETAAFEGSLYADYKLKVLQIPSAQPGSVIGYEFDQQEYPWALQDVWSFQQTVPIRSVRYIVNLPAGWKHEENWFNGKAIEPSTATNSLVWEMSDVPAIRPEPDSPSLRTLAGHMAINFLPPQQLPQGRAHRTWDDVAHWFYGLADGRRAATPELQAKTRELTAGKTSTFDKIAALAAFAQRDVRYVAIEIGIGGIQPHMAGEIFSNRYGDCKDKVTVLSAMLHEIGVDSYFVLANATRGVVEPSFASMASCNHAIIAIKLPADAPLKNLYPVFNHPKLGKLLLFDPTSHVTPLGYLPDELQESRVVLITPDGGEVVSVPSLPSEANRLDVTAKLKLDDGDVLQGEVREVRTGMLAAHMRSYLTSLKSDTERKQYVERRFAYHMTQSNVSDLVIENLDDIDKDLVFRCNLRATGYSKRAAGMLLVRPRVFGQKSEGTIDMKERKFGYVTQGPSLETDEFEIAVPPGHVPDELPSPLTIATNAVSYTSESKFEHDVLRYKRRYKVQTFGVPLAGLAELNKAFSQISADERSSAVFK
jgi:hypothetical protein